MAQRRRRRRWRPVHGVLLFGILCLATGFGVGSLGRQVLYSSVRRLLRLKSGSSGPAAAPVSTSTSLPSLGHPGLGRGTKEAGFVTTPPPVDRPQVPVGTLPTAALINVAPKDQYPQFPNGCEVTSLAMLLTAVGHPYSKVTLAKEMPVDLTKRIMGSGWTIKYWGNPNVGFVGQVIKKYDGYGIYHGPMFKFLNHILPGRAVDLTGEHFSAILAWVARGTPVEAWTTTTFAPTNYWVTWQSPEGPVHATPYEHAVLIVGYDSTQLFVNNPLTGAKAEPVNRAQFIRSWVQLGRQAITVRP